MLCDSSARPAWLRAVRRAHARGLTAREVGYRELGYGSVTFYDVDSHSTRGLLHRVRVDVDGRGVSACCDCEGGQGERVCQHAAAALLASGFLALPPDLAPEEIGAGCSNDLPARPRISGAEALAMLRGDDDDFAFPTRAA